MFNKSQSLKSNDWKSSFVGIHIFLNRSLEVHHASLKFGWVGEGKTACLSHSGFTSTVRSLKIGKTVVQLAYIQMFTSSKKFLKVKYFFLLK